MIRLLSGMMLWLGLLLPGIAAEFMGADKALDRLQEELNRPPKMDEEMVATLAFAARVNDLAGKVGSLPPAEAVEKWLALVDEWRALPPLDEEITDSLNFGFPLLFSALPGPEAWDALDAAVKARPRKGTPRDVALNSVLRALGATLRGDLLAAEKAMQDSWKAGKAGKESRVDWDRGYAETEMYQWLYSVKNEKTERPRDFEADLKSSEQHGHEAEGVNDVPELVESRGAAKAEALLKRLLVLKGVDADIDDKATRLLAVKVALKLGNRLTRAQWRLVDGISDEEAALFELMKRRYPKEGIGTYEHDKAEIFYLNWLLMEDRRAEAVKLATAISKRSSASISEISDGLLSRSRYREPEDPAVVRRMAVFLRDLLEADPELFYWKDLSSYSREAGMDKELMDFLHTILARKDLALDSMDEVSSRLVPLLLAADQVEEGGELLRQMLDRNMAIAAKEEESYSHDEKNLTLALRLAELGRLTKKADWLEAGIAAVHATWLKKRPIDRGSSGSFVELMFKVNRPAEVEEMLVNKWIWEAIRQTAQDQNGMGDIRPLLNLVDFYDRTGRPMDVYKLIEKSPSWYEVDLADLINSRDQENDDLALPAARAMAAMGKKEDSRKLLVAFLQRHGDSDPAYAALLELGGNDLGALLDSFLVMDRYEERPLIWKAQWLLQQGKIEDAEKAARAAIKMDPSDGKQAKGDRLRAYAVLADILEKKGEASQAAPLRAAVKAVRLAEDADEYGKAGLLTRAISTYEEALKHSADDYCIQSQLALAYMKQGDETKAAEHCQRAFELMGERFGAVEEHCSSCAELFRNPLTRGVAEQVLERRAAAPEAKARVFYLLGHLRRWEPRWDAANMAYQRAVVLDPDYLNAWDAILSMRVPHAEMERAALNLLRLDPIGRHGGGLSQITDFRAAWPLLQEAAKRRPTPLEPMMELKPSKEALLSPEGVAGKKLKPGAPTRIKAGPSTPGQEAGRHAAFSAIGRAMDIIKNGRKVPPYGGC